MNETIPSISVGVILCLLLFWGAAQFLPLARTKSQTGGRKSRTKSVTKYFTAIPIIAAPITSQEKSIQVLEKVSHVTAYKVEMSIPHTQPQAPHTATPASLALAIEVEHAPQITQRRNFRHLDLRHFRLRGQNLAGVDLSHCNLVRANLALTNLHGAKLAYADLTNAILVGANLSGCDCTGARFHGANLDGANLRDCDLTDTRFGPTTRPQAEVYGGKDGSHFSSPTIDIIGANLRNVDTKGANCVGSDIARGHRREDLYWTIW